MSTTSGHKGIIKISANKILDITDWTLTETAALRNTTSIGQDSVGRKGDGITDATGSFNCNRNYLDTTGQELLAIGNEAVITLQPDGDSTGLQTITIPIVVKDVTTSGGKDVENTGRSISWEKGEGDVVRGTVA